MCAPDAQRRGNWIRTESFTAGKKEQGGAKPKTRDSDRDGVLEGANGARSTLEDNVLVYAVPKERVCVRGKQCYNKIQE